MIPPSVVLETDRVRLRQFHPSDEADLVRVFDDPYAQRFYPDMAGARRFERLGDLYHLLYTERSEWPGEGHRS